MKRALHVNLSVVMAVKNEELTTLHIDQAWNPQMLGSLDGNS